jgi:hypothetical protein
MVRLLLPEEVQMPDVILVVLAAWLVLSVLVVALYAAARAGNRPPVPPLTTPSARIAFDAGETMSARERPPAEPARYGRQPGTLARHLPS